MLIKVKKIDEIKENSPFVVWDDDVAIIVLLKNGEYFAFNRQCPHAKGDLLKAKFENCTITCVSHGLVFDLHNGTVKTDELDEDIIENSDMEIVNKYKLETYKVSVIDDELYIEV